MTSQVYVRFVGPRGDYCCEYQFDEKTKYLKVPPEVLVSLVKDREHYREAYFQIKRRSKYNKKRSQRNKKRIAELENKVTCFYDSLEAWSRK